MPRFSSDDRRALLTRARQAIVEAVVHQDIACLPQPAGRLAEPGGAFVTLHLRGRLRGCIGRSESSGPLAETVAQCAIGAALHDPRFSPVNKEELPELEIEISVLSALSPISVDAIEVGMHGLLVSRAEKRGLLLPQVAAERQWTAEQFAAETCRKAGLDRDAWRDPQTRLLGFTVEVFSEADFRAGYSSST
jgi:AmmeMemoRadiSam system protein A